MKICLAGPGAFGTKHLAALKNIEGVEVASVVADTPSIAKTAAETWGVPHWTCDLAEGLARPGVEAAILATPTQIHAAQAEQCLRAGKHVLVEIPMADSLADAEHLVRVQKETGLVAMVGHVRRFNPSHQWIHKRIKSGELNIQQMNVQTYFLRRTNLNAEGKPRTWTDHLLWHHACHTVDLFLHQTGELPTVLHALQGPPHSELGIAMDMGIQLKVSSGKVLTLSLSFNNDGPFGSFFRYICDRGTYKALYDDLVDGYDKPIDLSNVDVSMNGIELEDREFVAAIRDGRTPLTSFARCLPTMRVLDALERQMTAADRAATHEIKAAARA